MIKRTPKAPKAAALAGIMIFALVLMAVKQTKGKSDLPVLSAGDETTIVVYFVKEEVTKTVLLEEHLAGVLAGEIPASFSYETKKAQAVAARTYIMYKKGSKSHEGRTDVCTDYRHCKTWLSEVDVKELHKNSASKVTDGLRSAVMECLHTKKMRPYRCFVPCRAAVQPRRLQRCGAATIRIS